VRKENKRERGRERENDEINDKIPHRHNLGASTIKLLISAIVALS
jgi:hypothetical protein